MTRIAIAGFFHEINSFASEENHEPTAYLHLGEEIRSTAHPRSYIGGFLEGAQRPDGELVPIADVSFLNRGVIIHAHVFEHYRDIIGEGLRNAQPLDGVYFALHGAAAVQAPYEDAEVSLIRAVRAAQCERMPFVATYDFHGNYTDWEVTGQCHSR